MTCKIGIDLGGTKIEAVLLTADGAELWRTRITSPATQYDAILAAIVGLVEAADRANPSGQPATIGIGIPGAADPTTDLVKNANTTVLIGRPFRRDLEAALGRPVRLQNDANCLIASEATDGAAAGAAIAFGIILGTGVGGGLAINGRPHDGINAIAGEWGHNPLPWPSVLDGMDERPGPACYCGKHGCIETFLSGPGLARDHHAATTRDWTAEQVVAAAASGDLAAEAAMLRYEDRLARATATLLNILDPDLLVLGGGLSKIDRLYGSIPERWKRYVFSGSIRTRLVPARHGDASGVRGAACLWP